MKRQRAGRRQDTAEEAAADLRRTTNRVPAGLIIGVILVMVLTACFAGMVVLVGFNLI